MIPEIWWKRKIERPSRDCNSIPLQQNIIQHMNPFLFPPQPDPIYGGPPGMLPPGMMVTGPPMIINGPPQPLGMGLMGPPMVVTTATPITITVCLNSNSIYLPNILIIMTSALQLDNFIILY